MRLEFTAELWRWDARAELWVFARLPAELSEDVRAVPRPRSGFGAVPAQVTCGGSTWRTSIFPETAEGAYVLPVKKAVRTAEGLALGDEVGFVVELLG